MTNMFTNMFYGPTSGVLSAYGVTQGAYFTHDPIILPYRPPLLLIFEQNWLKMVQKHVAYLAYLLLYQQ
jgi:hypothetical protein